MTGIGNHRILVAGMERPGDRVPWYDHPRFEGVHMKDLVVGRDTEGRFSCHLIRIDPEKAIGEHVHEGSWELHEVLEGSGTGGLNADRRPYHPGVAAVLPMNERHRVDAGPEGLVLLAKFVPALV